MITQGDTACGPTPHPALRATFPSKGKAAEVRLSLIQSDDRRFFPSKGKAREATAGSFPLGEGKKGGIAPFNLQNSVKIFSKNSLQRHCICVIIRRLEYAVEPWAAACIRVAVVRPWAGQDAPTTLTKHGLRGHAGVWTTLCSLYADVINDKDPSAQESTSHGGVPKWHVLRALTCPEKSVWKSV